MYTALLSSNPLFISFTKTFTKLERFQSHRLSVVSVLGCTWYTTLVILYILDSAFLCLKNEQTGAGRDDRTCLARPNGTNGKRKNIFFPVQLITSWIDNLTRLIYSLHTHVHKTSVCSVKSGKKWTDPTLRARSFCYTKSCTNIAPERGSVAPLYLTVMSAPGTMVTHTFSLARV